MIRINLLPVRQERQAAASRTWVAIFAVGILLEALVVFIVDQSARSSLEEKRNRNAALQAEIEQINNTTRDLDTIRSKLEKSHQLEDVVAQLQKARSGPTRVLLEISRIMSDGRGPTIDPARLDQIRAQNPLAGFNPAWQTNRLFLQSYHEENREVRMTGLGRTNEDVAEFLHRLQLSDFFYDVTLTKTQENDDTESGLTLISFELAAKVRY